MYVGNSQLTASDVLRVFRHDALYLFLGAAFTTVGLVAAAFSVLRRRFDVLLICLALFAILYGQRLWLQSGILALTVPPSPLFDSLRASISYLVPIPAFLYFAVAGFGGSRGRPIAYVFSFFYLCIFLGVFVFGPLGAFRLANNIVVIAALSLIVARSLTRRAVDRDFAVLRRGLLVFVAFALCDNIAGVFGHYPYIEPLGFAFFLGSLGYVAGHRTLRRDQEFSALQQELDIARRIQTSILPASFPDSSVFRVAARYLPMTAVAGDFYDFLLTGPEETGLLIADVSGHGVPAALIASMVKLAATSQRNRAADPAALLSSMNSALCGNTQNQFVTAAYVHLDAASGKLRYSAAAHPPMLLLRNGDVMEIEENGLMLAAFSFATYSSAVHALEPGDRLVLYTDGIIEAANARKEEFGQARLHSLLRESAQLSHAEAADLILSSVENWSESQDDDRTVLVCDYLSAM